MDATQSSIPDLVAAARAEAKMFEARISGASAAADRQSAIKGLEAVSVDIFTVFEARMQHHFKRGPFSRKLKGLLVEAGQGDLADRVHGYYLAINVLKHGKGASYRELLKFPSALVTLNAPSEEEEQSEQAGLIDVAADGFFEGLSATILDAYHFLENR